MQAKKILILGGSYAGLSTAVALLDLCEGRLSRFDPTSASSGQQFPIEITIVDERDGYYHLIGSPLALADKTFASKAWVRFSDIPGLQHPAISVIHGSVSHVDCDRKVACITKHGDQEIHEQEYDYFVAASGLRRVWPVVPQGRTKDDYLVEIENHVTAVTNAEKGVVVIGGGAVGIEMAAELKYLSPSQKVTLIHSRARLLSSEPLPDDFKDETLNMLRGLGVEVLTGLRVQSAVPASNNSTTTLSLSDDSVITTSHVINAISKAVPTASYLPPWCFDHQGLVKIDSTTNFARSSTTNFRYHFAVGDIAAWSGIKRCGAAMHMGHYAAWNIYHDLHQLRPGSTERSVVIAPPPELKSLNEHPPVIGLALGGTAIAYGSNDGIERGEELRKNCFGDDLAWTICWNYMRLGETPPSTKSPCDSTVESTEDIREQRVGGEEGKVIMDVQEDTNVEERMDASSSIEGVRILAQTAY